MRNSPRGRRDTNQLESTQGLVARGHLPLALKHVDGYRRLAVRRRRKDLAFFGRYGGVFFNQPGHDTAKRFNPQRQRCHIQQQDVFDIALENTALNGSTKCNNLVGIYTFVGFLTEYFFDPFLNRRHTGHAADQNHFIDVAGGKTGIR